MNATLPASSVAPQRYFDLGYQEGLSNALFGTDYGAAATRSRAADKTGEFTAGLAVGMARGRELRRENEELSARCREICAADPATGQIRCTTVCSGGSAVDLATFRSAETTGRRSYSPSLAQGQATAFAVSEADALEGSALASHAATLPFPEYLQNGYGAYRWVMQTRMRGAGAGQDTAEAFNFALARHINLMPGSGRTMGTDLEVKTFFNAIAPNELASADTPQQREVLARRLAEWIGSDMSLAEAQGWVDTYLSHPDRDLRLSDVEFHRRLAGVPSNVLDAHSRQVWRGTGAFDSAPNTIDLRRLRDGYASAPPAGFHVGVQMLRLGNYLPSAGTEVRRYKPGNIVIV